MSLPNSDGRLEKFPFTIRRLNPTTHLIRETDQFHEYPNIYVKTVFQTKGSTQPALIVLSDTGCGTNNADHLAETLQRSRASPGSGDQPSWISSYFPRNLGSFLRTTFNLDGTLPYLVITTHWYVLSRELAGGIPNYSESRWVLERSAKKLLSECL